MRRGTHLHRRAGTHFGYIAQQHGLAAADTHNRHAQLLYVGRPRHAAQDVLVAEIADDPSGGVTAHGAAGVLQVTHADAVRVHLQRVGKDLVLLVVASDDGHLRHTAGSEDSGFDHPVRQRPQLHHRGAVRLHADEQDFAHDR